jgi:signal transduction histidine kinase
MSLRLRLTLLYTGLLALTLLAFGWTLYTLQARSTLSALGRDLRANSERVASGVLRADRDPPLNPPPGRGPLQDLAGEAAFRALREREIVRVLDPRGVFLVSPMGPAAVGEMPAAALPLAPEGLAALNGGQEWWQTAVVDGERLFIYNRPLQTDGELRYIIQTARPLTERDRSLAALLRALIGGGAVALVLTGAASWALAGAALRPVQRIIQTAAEIGAERDFTRRVAYTGPNDEIGTLAQTFNAMLARLQDAYGRVSAALTQQRLFVADVSHELRTPLTTVRGNLELLRHEPPLPPVEQADILADLVEESDRLSRLVNDLLVLAHADAGRTLTVAPFPLAPLLAETARQIAPLARGRDFTLDLPRAQLDPAVVGDRDALKQVLLILLDNAFKHTRGAVTLTAQVERRTVVIGVQDQGPGIAAQDLPRLFDRFYRGAAAPNRPGFGLGLAIAKALIEAQGGTITLVSLPTAGTRAEVRLPTPPG